METMALILKGMNRLESVGHRLPVPVEGEAILHVAACGVCRTDARMVSSGHRDLVLPRIPGHEFCGFVDGGDGTLFSVWPGTTCGSCRYCISGRENLCPSMRIIGFHRDGGFAGSTVVPRSSLIAVPQGLSAEQATLAEPLACSLHALRRLGLRRRERLLVQGAGTLGLLLALGAADLGADVVVTDPDAGKLSRSEAFLCGFGIEACAGLEQVAGTFDCAVNAAAAPATLQAGLARLAPDGRFCLFSGLQGGPDRAESMLNGLHYRELQILGSYGCTRADMRCALDLLSRHTAVLGCLIEARISLGQVPGILSQVVEGRSFRFVSTR